MKKFTLPTKKIAYAGVLTAIAVVLNIFDINLFGNSNKLTFTYTVSFVAGIFFGPVVGLTVGALGDVIGFLIKPSGVWIPTITLASALIGFIPGLIFYIFNKDTGRAADLRSKMHAFAFNNKQKRDEARRGQGTGRDILNKIKPYVLILISFAIVFVVCTAFINTLSIYYLILPIHNKTFWLYLTGRLFPFQSVIVAINIVLVCALYNPLKNFFRK
jgi:Protein of unknown function (DUF1393).